MRYLPILVFLIFAACGATSYEDNATEHVEEIEAAATPSPAPSPTPLAVSEPVIYIPEPGDFSFETGTYGFSARGAGVVTRTNETARAGDYSLLITGRTASWNGITVDVTDRSEPFGEYELTLWVKPTDATGATNFQITAEFMLDGSPTWRGFNGTEARVRAQPGEWTFMRGTLPFYGFDVVNVYIETDGSGATADFFIDDVSFRSISVEYAFDDTLPRLFEIYEDYFLFGTAVVPRDMRGTRLEFIRHHFNSVTAGNDMKPDAIQARPGQFTFDVSDEIVRETLNSGMYMIGHTLAWHSQSPDWMNPAGISREEAIDNLVTHITEVVTRYKGQVIVWDVVNEAFPSSVPVGLNPSDWRSHLRPTPWLAAIGYEYIEIAFRAAHAADPNAILIYNDYNMDNVGKREAAFHMIKELRENGVPIHGVGMQGHYNLRTNPQHVENSIIRFRELGDDFLISITELDITAQGALGHDIMPELFEMQQAVLYARLFQIFRYHSDAIHRVTLWGLCDATSWRADRFPLPFNRDLSAKLAFHAIADPDGFLELHG
ncbi:MAG: endo-1,4-beta-xylanase [Defluviitaleaceae bacterium]|nr:endo-1,4-beta-xylanase [Defluviitaleaceae bacterium]